MDARKYRQEIQYDEELIGKPWWANIGGFIVGLGRWASSKLKRAAPQKKTVAEVVVDQIQKKPLLMFYDKVVLSVAAIIGMLGVILIYNQLPTHPLIVIGITCVCVSVGVITGISRW